MKHDSRQGATGAGGINPFAAAWREHFRTRATRPSHSRQGGVFARERVRGHPTEPTRTRRAASLPVRRGGVVVGRSLRVLERSGILKGGVRDRGLA